MFTETTINNIFPYQH